MPRSGAERVTAIPKRIKIGSARYRVLMDAEEIKRVSDEADTGADGEWVAFSDHVKLIIALNPAHADDANRHSLVHEILHCCLRQSGAWPNSYARLVDEARGRDDGSPVEEFTVSAMSGPLLSVLRENPKLLAFLRG